MNDPLRTFMVLSHPSNQAQRAVGFRAVVLQQNSSKKKLRTATQ